MGKDVTIELEIEQDLLEKFEFIAAKNERSVEEEISNAVEMGFAEIKKVR